MRLLDPTAPHPADAREIRGVLPDRHGRLWLSLAEGGIGAYDIERREFRRYGRRDGVIVSEGRRGAFFASLDGTIYCGGAGRITWFHPDSIMDDESQPYVAVTQFLVFHEPVKLPPGETTPLPLAYWQNTLSIEFALLDFREIDENSYQYMLEGADKDWIPSVREHEVTYANVSIPAVVFEACTPGPLPSAERLSLRACRDRARWSRYV